MSKQTRTNLTRIGVFYDGNYFYHISNYYNYTHPRRSRISIAGLHDFIRHKIAEFEGDATGFRFCQIADAHYFRGRLTVKSINDKRNRLYYDRVFDDVLMSEGVTTHYLPVRTLHGPKDEKIDVLMALEVFHLALRDAFDVVVLIASDSDYVPLVKKLNTLGVRVMLLSWDFEYTDNYGNDKVTKTSQDLLEIVTYPLAMKDIIDDEDDEDNELVNNLFVAPSQSSEPPPMDDDEIEIQEGEKIVGEILSIKNGYGFIKYPPSNLFFHYLNVVDLDFNELETGDRVKFRMAKNEQGEDIATDVEWA